LITTTPNEGALQRRRALVVGQLVFLAHLVQQLAHRP
jgi:hypothetical protein